MANINLINAGGLGGGLVISLKFPPVYFDITPKVLILDNLDFVTFYIY